MGLFLSSADGVFIFRILYSARKVVYKGKCHDRDLTVTALYRFNWHLKRQKKKKRKDWRIPNPKH